VTVTASPGTAAPAPGRRAAPAVLLFTATSFLSACLLFLVQPMVAKLVLPPYGGSAAVWNTTNAFFQAALVAGYAYSHVLTRRVRPRRQVLLHVAALLPALAVLPLALPGWAAPPVDRSPALWLVLVLAVSVGLPFLAVATTGPLLQRWFSYTDHHRAADPYFLYAAGNVGSFVALLAYPLLVEPRWSVPAQARGWAAGYVVLIALVGACGLHARRAPGASLRAAAPSPVTSPTPDLRRRLRWLVLAAIPSSLMLGVTSFVTADLAAVPLLWVLPLSIYLATFVVAFGRPVARPLGAAPLVLLGTVGAVAVLMAADGSPPVVAAVAVHLALLAAGAYVAHRKLSLDRPEADRLTGFYLVVALGGVVGGAWNAFAAPLLFDRVVEYPLALVAVAAVGLGGRRSALRSRYGVAAGPAEAAAGFLVITVLARAAGASASGATVLAVAVVAGAALAVAGRLLPVVGLGAATLALAKVVAPLPEAPLLESRTFFGVHRVQPADGRLELVSGSTVHGAQDPDDRGEPLTYYTRGGPAGQVMATFGAGAEEVGLVGLGVGALAAYGDTGQRFTVYEIDPEVVRIARDTGLFTYLADTSAAVDYRIGDGRLELAAEHDRAFDVLVLDAFSGDAIPVHLLTVEAFATYRDRLAPDGVVAVHISNRYLDLRPVLAGAAEAHGMAALVRRDPAGAEGDGSWWAVLAEDEADLAPLAGDDRWRPVAEAGVVRWTDTRSNLLAVLGVEPPR
jgi:hypothetical protein